LKKNFLGNTGIEVTELCFGTLILGTLQANLNPLDGAKAIKKAFDQGVNFIDTAKGYKTYEHTRLGIEGYKDIIISSKSPVKSYEEMKTDVETCLNELRRDVIDIFHLHLIRSTEDMNERKGALDALIEMRSIGKIRKIGLSSHGVKGTKCALEYSDIDIVFPVMNIKGLGITDGTKEEMIEVIRELRKMGKGIYAMKPLGGGHLIDQIPSSINYLRETSLFDSIAVGLKDTEEVEIMTGVFENDPKAIEFALKMGKEKLKKKKLIIYDFVCQKCGECIGNCAQGALSMGDKCAEVNSDLCILCGYCAASCPRFAIRVI
jgi:uncharacterized protein